MVVVVIDGCDVAVPTSVQSGILVVVEVVVVVLVGIVSPVPSNVQSVKVISPLSVQFKGTAVVVVVVVELVRDVVVVVVGGLGTNSPTIKSKSSQHPFIPE